MNERRFMRIAKALADPKRFSILRRIAADPGVSCQRLLGEFGVTAATMSHHLKELAGAELIDKRREGKTAYLTLRPETVADYHAELARQIGPTAAPRRRKRGE